MTASDNLQEKVLVIEAIWSRTSIQIEFTKRIMINLQEEHCRIHLRVFKVLCSKLATAILIKGEIRLQQPRWRIQHHKRSREDEVRYPSRYT